jgi:hypothetical protein
VKLRNYAGEFIAHDGISPGEIVVRSPWAVEGYYDDPIAVRNFGKAAICIPVTLAQ